MKEVIRGLYVSNLVDFEGWADRRNKGMTDFDFGLVVSCLKDYSQHKSVSFEHMIIEIDDVETENILQFFKNVCIKIGEVLGKGENVLVHCVNGVSRSCCLIAAYLMSSQEKSFNEVYDMMKRVVPKAEPNRGFVVQLKYFGILKASENLTSRKDITALFQDDSVVEYRRYCVEAMGQLAAEWCLNGSSFRKIEKLDSIASSFKYSCQKCRAVWFYHTNVIPHPNKGKECTVFFIEPLDWVAASFDFQNMTDEGKLGQYKLKGQQCSLSNAVKHHSNELAESLECAACDITTSENAAILASLK
eukprot:Nk52_evm7s360 gene=Nk52_evmTU7s360